MQKESLEIASEIIFKAIDESNINIVDKVELLRNLRNLLDSENYDRDIKILELNQKRRWLNWVVETQD